MASNTYDPTNGEKPLDQLPSEIDAGGGIKTAQVLAGEQFAKVFGRNPTQSELDSLAPAYQSGDPNIADRGRGNSTIAQYYQSKSNTPDQINKSNQDKYLAEAPKHFDSINQMFQSSLGRAATQDELNHFGSLLASGTTDSYQLQQFLQQQPEYAQKQDTEFQNKLSGQLQGFDKQYFGEKILPSIQEAYAKQGRSFDSSAFANSATQSAQGQNTEREQYLAQLSASQYGGRQQNAYNDYANMVANQQNLTNQGINAQYTGVQRTQDRINQISDYNTQAQAYNQYLAKYGKRSNAGGIGALIGGGAGIAGAFLTGNPEAAGIGYQIGSGLGGAAGNAYGGSY